jgi:iron complex outermembrane recepter protein
MIRFAITLTVGLLATTAPLLAQEVEPAAGGKEEAATENESDIIVTARRRDERLQDVPLTVNAITNQTLQDLNIRNFQDVTAVVPGLAISSPNFTVRGVTSSLVTSGNNTVVAFYFNDAWEVAGSILQTVFDVGQIELLRGPQGTLRGRAAPSGSMTLTTRRPDLQRAGGYVTQNATHLGLLNVNGAVGVPIIPDVLALRLAAVYEEGPGSNVASRTTGMDGFSRTKGWRATLRFRPIDEFEAIFTAQRLLTSTRSFSQQESNEVAEPQTAQVSRQLLRPEDRAGLADAPSTNESDAQNYNLQARLSLFGQRLSYVGSRVISRGDSFGVSDSTDYYGSNFPALTGFGSPSRNEISRWTHEIRLSSEERLFGALDYTVGYFTFRNSSPAYLNTVTIRGVTPLVSITTAGVRNNVETESSFFGNLNFHIGEKAEISGGVRHLSYSKVGDFVVGGVPTFTQNDNFDSWIWTASAKYNFNPDLMAYFAAGTSWRPASAAIGYRGNFLTDRLREFTLPPDEKSTSFEVGLKSTWLDRRMTLNISAYHQKFTGFPFSTRAVHAQYSTVAGVVTPSLPPNNSFVTFSAGVPAQVWGGELEWAFVPNEFLNMSAGLSYAKSKISNGRIPCADYVINATGAVGSDGIADNTSAVPSAATIDQVTGGQGVGVCTVDGIPIAQTPEWSGFFQAEGRIPVSQRTDAFLRTLVNWYSSYDNVYANPFDDVRGYAMLNLYAGLRDKDRNWELTIYGKNLTNTFRVLTRDQSSIGLPGPAVAGQPAYTGYRSISVTAPREFGVTFRYSFGSR